MESLDIVKIVEESPLTRFGDNVDYQSKLVTKLRNKFNTDEEHLFLASFYTYLNCKPNDFIVELRKVWKWLGFSRVEESKRLLTKEFQVDKDYKVFRRKAENSKGGRPLEDTFLTQRDSLTLKRVFMRYYMPS